VVKIKILKTPARNFPKNILVLEIGSDNKILIVFFSISSDIKALPEEIANPISIIGQRRLKCLPEIKPSNLVKDFGSRLKALTTPSGKFFTSWATLTDDP